MRKREPDGTQISFTIIPLAQTSLVLSVLFSLEAGRRVAYRGEERDWTLWSLLQNVFPVTLPPSKLSVLIKHTHMIDDMIFILFLYYFITLYVCTRPLEMTVNSVKSLLMTLFVNVSR